MKFLQRHGYAIYLGVACASCDIGINDWRYWIIILPTILLAEWAINYNTRSTARSWKKN